MQPPPYALNALPEKGGPGGAGGGAPTPWVQRHPRPARSPPPCSGGLLAGPRWLPRWCSSPSLKFGWALLVVSLNAPSWLRILVCFHMMPYKTCMYQNLWRMLVIIPNSKLLEFIFVSLCLNVGGRNLS